MNNKWINKLLKADEEKRRASEEALNKLLKAEGEKRKASEEALNKLLRAEAEKHKANEEARNKLLNSSPANTNVGVFPVIEQFSRTERATQKQESQNDKRKRLSVQLTISQSIVWTIIFLIIGFASAAWLISSGRLRLTPEARAVDTAHYRTFFRVTTCRRAGSGRNATGNGWSSLSR